MKRIKFLEGRPKLRGLLLDAAILLIALAVAFGVYFAYCGIKTSGFSLSDSSLFQTTSEVDENLADSDAATGDVSDQATSESTTTDEAAGDETASEDENASNSTSTSTSASSSTGKSTSSTGSLSSGANSSASSSDTDSSESSSDTSTITVSLTIDCKTAVANDIPEALAITSSGTLLSTTVTLSEGATVYDVLKKSGVVTGANSTSLGVYVYSIGGLAERVEGYSGSGWIYFVNGDSPSESCNKCVLSDGDVVRWRYTCDSGKDL